MLGVTIHQNTLCAITYTRNDIINDYNTFTKIMLTRDKEYIPKDDAYATILFESDTSDYNFTFYPTYALALQALEDHFRKLDEWEYTREEDYRNCFVVKILAKSELTSDQEGDIYTIKQM